MYVQECKLKLTDNLEKKILDPYTKNKNYASKKLQKCIFFSAYLLTYLDQTGIYDT